MANLKRVTNEELAAELQARLEGSSKFDPRPVDTRQNHTLLGRDSLGRFVSKR